MRDSKVVRGCVALALTVGALVAPAAASALPGDEPTVESAEPTTTTVVATTTTVTGASDDTVPTTSPSTTAPAPSSTVLLPPPPPPPAGASAIAGRVTDSAGNPIANVMVSASPTVPGGFPGNGLTRPDGTYTIGALADGTYRVQFSAPLGSGFIGEYYDNASSFAAATPVAVSGGATTPGIDATLDRGGSISGRVTDSTGAPIANVNVFASPAALGGFGGGGLTRPDGTYTIGGLTAGNFRVQFSAPLGSGFIGEYFDNGSSFAAATPVAVTVGTTTSGIDAVLDRGGSIAGRVTDSNGSPVAGASVSATPTTLGGAGASGITDATGAYMIAGLAAGSYRVQFSAPFGSGLINEFHDDASSAVTATPVVVSGGATTSGIDAALERGGSITGRVTDGSGAPLAEVSVSANGALGEFAFGFTDEDGVYVIEGLPTSSYRVRFSPPFGAGLAAEYYDDQLSFFAATPVPLTAGATTSGIDAVLAPSGSISGRVTDSAGAPLAEIDVRIYDRGGRPVTNGTTDEDGRYMIEGLVAAEYRVAFQVPFGSTLLGEYFDDAATLAEATPVSVSAGSVTGGIDAVLARAATISGVVTDETGTPAAGVSVSVRSAGGFWGGSDVTDAQGAYSVGGLRSGDYRVEFAVPFGSNLIGEFYDDAIDADAATPVTVSTGEAREGIDAELAHGGSITGRVTDGAGVPVAGASVFAGRDDGHGRSAVTDDDGTYTVAGLRTGEYVVQITPPPDSLLAPEYFDDASTRADATRVPVTAGMPTAAIDAVLAEGGSIAGTVTDGDGDPITNATVWINSGSDDGFGFGFTSTDDDGRYVVDGLPAGRFTVLFSPPFPSALAPEYFDNASTGATATSVSVALGESTTGIDGVLHVGGTISGRVTDADGEPVANASVGAHSEERGPDDDFSGSAITDADGHYTVEGLASGEYRVHFSPGPEPGLQPEYFDDVATLERAAPVAVVVGESTDGIDAVLTPDGPPPATVPAAPGDVVAVAGHERAIVSWTAPDDGGAPITGYTVTASPGGQTCTTVAMSCVVTGLANGTPATFTVTATNDIGTGPASAPSTSVTPQSTAPDAPAALTAAVAPADGVGSGQVRLTWLAPDYTGGAAITDYVIQRSTDGVDWRTVYDGRSTALSATVSWLENGTEYWFRVAARNAIGTSVVTEPVTATPRWTPSRPLGLHVAVSSTAVHLSWSAPWTTGGAAITDYVIERSRNGFTWSAVSDEVSAALEATLPALDGAGLTLYRVRALNAVGTGPASIPRWVWSP